MIQRFDRLLLRVDSLPAAAKYWRDVHEATILREDRNAVTLQLAGGGEVVLHTDPNLPAQQFYLLVDDVRALHEHRGELKIDFRSPPVRGMRGYFATIRDPFGIVLNIADHTCDGAAALTNGSGSSIAKAQAASAVGSHASQANVPTLDESQPALFNEAVAVKHKPDRALLAELYAKLGRTADDLPYTTHFESLCDSYVAHFPDPKPDNAEVWRHLLTTRKAGKLPKLGAAKSAPPEVSDEDRQKLRDLLGDQIGKRDRLPYSPTFETVVSAFNIGRRRPYSPHQIWRLVATLAK